MNKLLIIFVVLILPFGLKAQVKILFNSTKAETAGSADWVIDADLHNIGYTNGPPVAGQGSESNPQRLPTPAQSLVTSTTAETYWNGGISAWGIDLVKKGYVVETLPYNGAITYGNSNNAQDLSNYKVFIDCEPNILYTAAEKTAIMQFVQNGGGLFMVSDHTISDRNNDGYDSPEIWNDLMTNNGIVSNPFGIAFDLADFSQTTTNIPTLPNDPILHGIMGNVTSVMWSNGTSMTLNPAANSSVKGIIYKTGSAFGNSNVMFAYASYGNGKVTALGDSSPCDDGSGDSGDVLYNGWTGDAGGNHERLIINATIWLASSSQALPTVTTLAASAIASTTATLNGSVNPNGAATTSHFEWGTTTSYGNSTATISNGSGTTAVNVSANLSGLTPGTTYHYRVSALNSAGTSNGSDLTFSFGTATLTTTAVSSITISGAVSGGNITADGGAAIIARGVCWSTSLNPTIADTHTSDGTGTGVFTSSMSGLTGSTNYHVRAYATNSSGTYYGGDVLFTTGCGSFTLPFAESFTATTIPGCWSQTDHQGNGEVWAFGTITGYTPLPALTGNYAYLNSDGYGSGNTQNADLVTPMLNLAGYTTVNLAFNHYFRSYTGTSGTVSYSIDNGSTWTAIATFTTTSSPNPTAFSQAVNVVAGQSQVKFKWNYTGTWGHYWGIDDVQITGTLCTPLPVSISVSPSANPVCAGTGATFTASPVNGGTTPAYQWKVNGVNAGTNSQTFSYIPVNLDVVTCSLTSNASCISGNPATSNAVTMSVNPILPVSVAVAASSNPACAGEPVTFTATPANGGTNPAYQWKVNGTIAGTNSPVLTYTPLNNDAVNCTLTSAAACTSGNTAVSNQVVITDYLINPTITGPATNCTGTAATYSTEPGMIAYSWNVSAGGQIVSGQATSIVSVAWNTPGSQSIGVIYSNGAGCNAPAPALLNLTVSALPEPAGVISGATAVCAGTQGVVYSVAPVSNATSYLWTIPSGAVIAAGEGTPSVTVNFSVSAFTGDFYVRGTNFCSSGALSPAFPVSSNPPLTGQVTLNDTTITSGTQECLAGQNITTAGPGTTYLVEGGATVTLMASEFILFLPGTTIQQTGSLHAFITDQCIPCLFLKTPLPGGDLPVAGHSGEERSSIRVQQSVIVYPNPTSGLFTIECNGDTATRQIKAEVYNARNELLITEEMADARSHVFSLSGKPAGIYFIRVIYGSRVETIKLIKT